MVPLRSKWRLLNLRMKKARMNMIASLRVLITTGAIFLGIAYKLPLHGQDSYDRSSRNENAILKHLRPPLRSIGKVARVYYRAECRVNSGDPVPFPRPNVRPPSKHKSGLPAIQEIFAHDKNVTVTQEASGTILIKIGRVSGEILRTRLRSLKLEPMEQYNATEAIGAIERTNEFHDAASSLGLKPVWSYSSPVVEPREELPHLPATIKDTTVEELLDLIAKTFNGIVIYGECDGENGARPFWIDFTGIAEDTQK